MRPLLVRLRLAVGILLSRDIAVLTNAIAFNFLLCLFPLVLFVTALAQMLPMGRGAGGSLLLVLGELIPFGHAPLADSVRRMTRMARGVELFSLLLIVWGASGIFIPVEMALNRAWGGRIHRDFWRSRSLAFLVTLGGAFLALGSIALTVAARRHGREWPLVAAYGAKGSALALTWTVFYLVYRFVPEAAVGPRVAARAALWSAGGWEAAKYAFVLNLGYSNVEEFYGPLSFAVSLVLWAYVSSLVLVFGALMCPVPGHVSGRADPSPPEPETESGATLD